VGGSETRSIVRLFAQNMRAARARTALSQEALAEAAGLHRTYIGSVERAERNVSLVNVARIAKALGVQPWELLHPRSSRAGAHST